MRGQSTAACVGGMTELVPNNGLPMVENVATPQDGNGVPCWKAA